MDMSLPIYIHVPFCRGKCEYCDFYSMPAEEGLVRRYVSALRREIQRCAKGEDGEVNSIYIGGGTPSVLPSGSIGAILNCLTEHSRLVDAAEVTVEANPESLTASLIDELTGAGVTRLSVGVQSFQDPELRTLGRPHTSSDALEALRAVSGLGGLDVSLDLMYSIPGQNLFTWRQTLEAAVGLRPSHISAYELTLESGTPLEQRVGRGELRPPHEDEALAMYHEARSLLADAGYEHYEVSNYALPGKRSRHNANYWQRGEYLGLGPGAVSFIDGVRAKNLPDLARYLDAIENGGLPPFVTEVPTSEEAAREFLMLGLRCREGVGLEEAASAYALGGLLLGAGMLIDEGFLASGSGRLYLSQKGMPVMNSVLVRLMESLGL